MKPKPNLLQLRQYKQTQTPKAILKWQVQQFALDEYGDSLDMYASSIKYRKKGKA